MRVVAARFPNRERAAAVLRALQQRLGLTDDDAAIAPLGTPGTRDDDEATLLAGRFDDAQTDFVGAVVTDGGGAVVADVDEQWTRPRIAAGNEPETPRAADPSAERMSYSRRSSDEKRSREVVRR